MSLERGSEEIENEKREKTTRERPCKSETSQEERKGKS